MEVCKEMKSEKLKRKEAEVAAMGEEARVGRMVLLFFTRGRKFFQGRV